MMQLLENAASPYCRKVHVLLLELDMADRIEMIICNGHPTAPNQSAKVHNPMGKIPTLLRPDGPAIYDSRVICRYLNEIAGGGLYPKTSLWETLTLEATADGVLDAAILMVYEKRSRADGKQDEGWIDGQWAKIKDALIAIEERWLAHLQGPMDMGVVAVGCALGYLDFRHSDRDWRALTPHLAEWFAEFSERPSMAATVPRDA